MPQVRFMASIYILFYFITIDQDQAVHKIKSVSCPAGGQNCGQSSSHKIFFLCSFFVKR